MRTKSADRRGAESLNLFAAIPGGRAVEWATAMVYKRGQFVSLFQRLEPCGRGDRGSVRPGGRASGIIALVVAIDRRSV